MVCASKGHAELAGCTLRAAGQHSTGLGVYGGTAEVQGGTIADCKEGVACDGSGSKATVRPPARAPPNEAPRYS